MKSRVFIFLFATFFANLGYPVESSSPVKLAAKLSTPLGKNFVYFKEEQGQLSFTEALHVFNNLNPNKQHLAKPVNTEVLSVGIGSKPIWLYLRLANDLNSPLARNLFIENIWVDELKIYLMNDEKVTNMFNLGDAFEYDKRLVDSRFFIIPHAFKPGETELLIRVETKDSINLPIYILTDQQLKNKNEVSAYSYGFLYGAILSLLLYNFIIFISLRDARYFYYSIFLSCFVIMNIAYTGHGFRWLWPTNTAWQMWCGSSTILLFNLSGLLFARKLLELKQRQPKLNRLIIYLSYLMLGIYAATFFASNNFLALITSMTFTLIYPLIMTGLGILALVKSYRAARYFLCGSVFATIGTTITSLSVWGTIPFNILTFRAVELGILLDMILLSLALAETVKESKHQKLAAENISLLDPLTGLYNRRGLFKNIAPKWHKTLNNQLTISAIMLDIDHFKTLNDTYGHQFGDQVLIEISDIIKSNASGEDIAVRWGGEELLVILINPKIDSSQLIAETIRQQIENNAFVFNHQPIQVTASIGVANLTEEKTIEELINTCDKQLYMAKNSGRNTVCVG